MKKKILLFTLAMLPAFAHVACGQGWHAEIHVTVGDDISIVENAHVSLSGFIAYDYSRSSTIEFELNGGGALPTGPLYIYVSGQSDDGFGSTTELRAQYNLTYLTPCAVEYFDISAEGGRVTGSIILYPQMEITRASTSCERISLATEACSSSAYRWTWEIAEHITGPFKALPERSSQIFVTSQVLSSLGITSYGRKFFRVTGAPGTTSSIAVVDVPYPPPTATFGITPPKCHNGSDGSIRVEITTPFPSVIDDFVVTVSGNGIEKQVVLDNTNQVSVSGLSAESYRILIENNSNIGQYGSCSREYQVGPLANPEAISVSRIAGSNYNDFGVSCAGSNDGAIEIKATGGSGVYQRYTWTPNVSTTASATHLVAGTYRVKVTDSNNCESDEAPYDLSAPEKLTLQLESIGGKGGFGVSCHDKNDGVITASVSGGVREYKYLWSDGSAESAITGVGVGVYSLSVTDANGCTAQRSHTLLAPEPITFDLEPIAVIQCAGGKTAALEVQSPEHTIGAVHYSWSSGETSKAITGKGAGTYSVTVYDDQGCSASRTHTFAEPASWSVDILPQSNYNGAAIRCNGESNGALSAVVSDGNGTVTSAEYYEWYKDDHEMVSGFAASSAEGLSAGSYRIRISYNTFCKTEETFVLQEPAPVVAGITTVTDYNGFPISCHNADDGALTATASGGTGDAYSYLWQDGTAEATLANVGAGAYVVTARDVNGCEGKTQQTVTAPSAIRPVITVLSNYNGRAISCDGAADARIAATASGGVSGFRYRWNTGSAGADLTDLPAGRYVVTASDANGCEASTSLTLSNPPRLAAAVSGASSYGGFGVSCYGSHDGYLSATADGGTGAYKFTWLHNGSHTARIANLPAQAYTVGVADQNGCSATADAVLTAPPPLTLAVTAAHDIPCHGERNGEIELAGDGGTGNFQYANGDTNWQTTPLFNNLNAGSYDFVVKDGNGCTANTTVRLTEPPPLAIHIDGVEPAFCGDARGSISAAASGGTGVYRYEWKDPYGNTKSTQSHLAAQGAGLYFLTVTDDHLCQAVESAGITATDGPNVALTQITDVRCFGSADGSAELKLVEGDGPFRFLWQDGQTQPKAVDLGRGNYLVEITDANNCTTVETVSIAGPDPLSIALSEKREPACHGDCNGTLRVEANGGNGNYSYDWHGALGATLANICPGTYEVTVSDEKGCTAKKAFVLGEPQQVTAEPLEIKPPNCHDGCDGKLELAISGGTGRQVCTWSTGATGPGVNNVCAGTYTATISDENGCSISRSFTLRNPAEDLLDLGGSVTLCTGQTHKLDPGPDWQKLAWAASNGFKSQDRRIVISEAGTYWLEATTFRGCVVRDTFTLQTSADLLNANFLLSSEATTGDTVVMIDISWPLPDHIAWDFPTGMNRLSEFGEIVWGRFSDPGHYDIGLTATLGECRDEITKSILVSAEREPLDESGRLGNEESVKEFILYPNPNDGSFDVSVQFKEPSRFVLTVWNTFAMKKIAQTTGHGKQVYLKHFDLRPLSSGSYVLRLDCGKTTRHLRFIVR